MGKVNGSTGEGLPPIRIGPLSDQMSIDLEIKARIHEEIKRMTALAEELGITDDPERWYQLALHLARQHVPGLKEAKPRHRPTKWGDFELGTLVVEIEREMQHPGTSATQAAKNLAQAEPWTSFLDEVSGTHTGPDPGAALLKQYKRAKGTAWARICRKAAQYHAAVGDVAGWDQMVMLVEAKRK